MAEALDQHEEIKEPPLTSMLFKDALLLLAALSIWAAAYSWFEFSDLLIAKVLMAADALVVGFIVASLCHEWGHYAGARGSGGNTTRFTGKPLSIFRFNFDFEQNTKSQFLWMSYGGQIGHWGVLAVLFFSLPLNNLAEIVLVSSIFGFCVFALMVEYKIIWEVLRGMDPLESLKKLNSKKLRTAQMIGGAAGIVSIILLG